MRTGKAELCPLCTEYTGARQLTAFVLLGRCERCGLCTDVAVVEQPPVGQMRLKLEAA